MLPAEASEQNKARNDRDELCADQQPEAVAEIFDCSGHHRRAHDHRHQRRSQIPNAVDDAIGASDSAVLSYVLDQCRNGRRLKAPAGAGHDQRTGRDISVVSEDRQRDADGCHDDPIMRFDSVPESVEVHLIDRPGDVFYGVAEAAQGPTGAALANAIRDATGVRLHQLPLTPARIRKAKET